jgi:hypothetical protein
MLACNFGATAATATLTAVPATAPPASATAPAATATVPPPPCCAIEANETPAAFFGPEINYGDVRFTLPPDLGSEVSARLVPASDPGPDAPYWEIYPAYLEFALADYVRQEAFHSPHIEVYPVAEFEAMNPDAADVIARLEQMLAERPAAPDNVPFLPLFNAAQVFRAQIQYRDFQTGSGVRFLTLYAQDFAPINNFDLFYTFQGLAADRSHYVSVILPVSASILPADFDAAADVPEGGVPFPSDFLAADYGEQYDQYIADVTQRLNELPPEAFQPALTSLDQLATSISAD